MKKLFIFLMACNVFGSCDKQSREPSAVQIFIETLKENEADRIEAPDFNVGSISELLKYRNDLSKISSFPRNPLSSFYMEEVTIGMYILWTIESIRMKAIDDPDFYLFASLNPKVVRASTTEFVDQDVILPQVATAYNEWWNSGLAIAEKLEANPLEKRDLKWN